MYGISYWLLLQRKCILSINEASRHGLAAYPGESGGAGRVMQGRADCFLPAVSLVSRRTSTNRPRRASGDAPRGDGSCRMRAAVMEALVLCSGWKMTWWNGESSFLEIEKLVQGMSPMNPAAIPAGFEGHSIKSIPIYRAGSSLHFLLEGGDAAGRTSPGLGSKGACNTP